MATFCSLPCSLIISLLFLTIASTGCDTAIDRKPSFVAAERPGPAAPRAVPGLSSPGGRLGKGAMAERELMRFRDPVTGRIPVGAGAAEHRFVANLIGRTPQSLARPAGSNLEIDAWESIGPAWEGGRTRAFAVDVHGRYLVAGSVSGGIFRQANHGDSLWRKTGSPANNQNVAALVQDVREGYTHIWYYATGELRGGPGRGPLRNSMGGGVYRSVDSGETWTLLPSTLPDGPADFDSPFEMAWRLRMDPTAEGPGTLYLAALGGIMRSDDGGESWRMVLGTDQGSMALYTDVVVTGQGVAYAAVGRTAFNGTGATAGATDQGIWRSEDGVEWTEITPEGFPGGADRMVLATAPSDSSILYLFAVTPGVGTHGHSLWRYRDEQGGGVWEDRSGNLPDDPQTDASWGNDLKTYTGFCMAIDVHPEDPDVVYLGGTNLYRSDNGFASPDETVRIGGYRTDYLGWAFRPYAAWYPGHHADQHGVVFWPGSSSVAFSITDGGVHLTPDALADTLEWFWWGHNYNSVQFRSVALDPLTPNDPIIVGGTQDNHFMTRVSEDEGFFALYAGDGANGVVDRATGSIYASNIDGKLWRVTLDDDGDVDSAGYIVPAGAPPFFGMFPFLLDPADTRRLYIGIDNTIWRNSDVTAIPITTSEFEPVSTNWTRLDQTRLQSLDDSDLITAIGITATPEDRLYFGRAGGRVHRLDAASTERAEASEITGIDFPRLGYVSCIAVDPRDGDRAIVVFSNYNVQSLFLTEDGGSSWVPVGGNLEENPDGTGNGPATIWLEIAYRGDEVLYLLGTTSGLFTTTELDGRETFWRASGGETIGRILVEQIDYRESDGLVVVATHGNGIYRSRLTSSVRSGRDVAGMNGALEIRSVGPQPLHERGTVLYHVPRSMIGAELRFELHSITGRRVRTMSAGTGSEGENRMELQREGLSSGLYILRIVGREMSDGVVIRVE